MKIELHPEKLTAKGRFRRAALYFGLPVTVLEIITLPFQPAVLLLAAPVFLVATASAYYTEAALAHLGQKATKPPH